MNPLNPYEIFATKHELRATECKVDDLIKGWAVVAASVEGLTASVLEINKNIGLLVINKGVSDGIKRFAIKCIVLTGSLTGGSAMLMITAHFTGIIKTLGRFVYG